MSAAFPRPAGDEHSPYYGRYIGLVPDGDLLATLAAQPGLVREAAATVGEAGGNYAYAPGKWTVKEVLAHMIDAERIFAYRALRIARGDTTPLPGFDENAYAPESLAASRTVSGLAEEFGLVRQATLALLDSLTPEVAARRGTASDSPVSVRAIAWIIAGHAAHHLGILRERYGAASAE